MSIQNAMSKVLASRQAQEKESLRPACLRLLQKLARSNTDRPSDEDCLELNRFVAAGVIGADAVDESIQTIRIDLDLQNQLLSATQEEQERAPVGKAARQRRVEIDAEIKALEEEHDRLGGPVTAHANAQEVVRNISERRRLLRLHNGWLLGD